MDLLNKLTATEAARRIAAGTITSEQLVRACLDRIAERDPQVEAWVFCDPDAAIAKARAIDKAGPRGPLAGVPVAFKDVIDTADMPTQYNSPIYANHRPRTDSAAATLTRNAGGIVLGKTVTTEFASRMPGPTRNPHNLAHTPGGSSSGSAASVADFMVPLAFGTQTGGSNIRPSAYCGIVGYKPSYGTICTAGLKQLADSLDTIGVMGRTVEDCALLAHAVSFRPLPAFTGLAAPRIGLHRTPKWKDASPAAQAALEKAAERLAAKGASVVEFDLPAEFADLYEEQELIMNWEAARALAPELASTPELLSDHLRGRVIEFQKVPYANYRAAMRHAQACRTVFTQQFAKIDVLLTLSAPGEAPEGITGTGSSVFNRNWTLLGAPCVTLPCGTGPKGLPLAVQIVGDYDTDEHVLRAAEWVRQNL